MKIKRFFSILLASFHHIHPLPGVQRPQTLSSATVISGFQILLIHPNYPKLEDTVLGLDQCIVVGLWHSKDNACCSAWSDII